VEKFIDLLGTAGLPSGFVGICLMLLFYVRRQEAGVRSDINGSLQRLTAEVLDLNEEIDTHKATITTLEDRVDTLRKERREAEDRADQYRRRAEAAEAKLGDTANDARG
jgi:predicted  nucleic acid-binding Zn-ribbon protein